MGFADLLAGADAVVRDHLGDTSIYAPGVGAPVEVRGVFDKTYVLVDPQNPGVSNHTPAIFLRLSELPGDAVNDVDARVTHEGVTYSVREAKPDGLGGVYLLLHRVS